ncbi:MAG: hypothetical protein ACM3U2_19955 [Deltaproteobacteria bacterium]
MSATERGRMMNEPEKPTSGGPPKTLPAPRRRRLWTKLAVCGFLGTLLFLAFAPQILSWSTLRHQLPRFRLPGFAEEIRVGRASLSWWGPIELWDIELYAPDGQPFVKVARVLEDRSVWQLATRPTVPVHVRLEKLEVNMLMRPDGSNVEDALAPVLAHPKRQRREKAVEIVDGIVRATDVTTGRMVEWKNVAVKTATEPDGTSPNRLRLRAELADAPGAEPLEVDVAWSSAAGGDDHSFGEWKGVVQTGNLPLAALGPLLGRFAPGLDLSGTISADLRLHSGANAKSGGQEVAGDCQLAARNFQVTWPDRLGNDHPTLEQAGFHLRFSSDGARCRIEKLVAVTDVCRLDGGGAFPVGDAPAASRERRENGQNESPNFSVRGALDLVALLRMLPQTLPMRDGAVLTDGKLGFELASLSQADRWRWKGRIETTRLAGQVGGEPIEWDRPLALTFDLHRKQGRWQIDSLECLSDVVRITGSGNSDGAHFEAGCDLGRLTERLGQFLDTASRQMRGNVKLAVDLSRDAEECPVVQARAEIDNLVIREQRRRMAERRRGDIQPVEFEVPAGPPALLPGQALDRKTMQARKRAEREAEREARRREREARKKADEIVMVPADEWKTVWSEARMTLSGQGRYVREKNLLELPRLEAVSDALHLTASGRLTDLFSHSQIDLEGETSIDMNRMVERFRETLGPHVQISGKETRRFSIHGPLRNPAVAGGIHPSMIPREMKGEASLGWKNGDLYGLQAGAADMDLALAEGVVTLRPLELEVSGGKLKLAGRALLNDGPARVVVPAGRIIENVDLTDEVCEAWMQFIAPILSQATRAEGRFSVDLDETRFPVADPAAADLSGRLTIDKGRVLPGPLFNEIGGLIGNILAASGEKSPRDVLGVDTPLVVIGRQEIKFKLQDRRIYHSPVEFKVRELVIRTRGSVGVDQTLDLVAEISFSDQLLSRARFLSPYRERPLVLPIRGTLRKPKVDPQVVGRLATEFGQNAVEGLINRGLQKLLERNE